MTSLSSFEIQREPAGLRRAVQQDGEVVALTFHGRPYGYVVPADQWHAITNDNGENAEQEADVT